MHTDGTVHAVVLAQGTSRRFGSDKHMLQSKHGRVIDRMTQALTAAGVGAVHCNHKDGLADIIEHRGPLSGIHAALSLLQKETSCTHLLCVPCDMPALTQHVFRTLIATAHTYTQCDAVHYRRTHMPLLLKNSNRIFSHITHVLTAGKDMSLHACLRRLAVHICTDIRYDAMLAININTPEDWRHYCADHT